MTLDALLHIAEQERLRTEEDVKPSLFPLFHWTERRLRAHIAICFAAFGILSRLYNTRHGMEASISEGQILVQLREVEVSMLRDNTTNRHFAIRRRPTVQKYAFPRRWG